MLRLTDWWIHARIEGERGEGGGEVPNLRKGAKGSLFNWDGWVGAGGREKEGKLNLKKKVELQEIPKKPNLHHVCMYIQLCTRMKTKFFWGRSEGRKANLPTYIHYNSKKK